MIRMGGEDLPARVLRELTRLLDGEETVARVDSDFWDETCDRLNIIVAQAVPSGIEVLRGVGLDFADLVYEFLDAEYLELEWLEFVIKSAQIDYRYELESNEFSLDLPTKADSQLDHGERSDDASRR